MTKDYQPEQHTNRIVDRRNFLWETGGGLGGIALASLLNSDGLLAAEPSPAANPLAERKPHFPARAKHVIQIFCPGAVSHLDTFDYKPELERYHGKSYDQKEVFFASTPGAYTKSYWKFRQRGESGLWMSDLLPKLAECVDDMAFVYSMHTKSALHGSATFMMNSGFTLPGFPSMGAWVTYGLGNETDELPAFVVLPDTRGMPPGGPANWGAGFLPAAYQGTAFSSAKGKPPIADLFPKKNDKITDESEAASRNFLAQLNKDYAKQRPGDTELAARIAAYEIAARLQLSAPEVSDLSQESQATKKLYGFGDAKLESFGRQCLLARRLVQNGVRFVQIWCGSENMLPPPRPNWDAHEDLLGNHGRHGRVLDNGAAALIKDLKAQGMLDETLVIWGSEFGRQPAAQGKGRDHNADAFTVWMAGGGIKGGVGYGASDDFGRRAAINPAYSYDMHATALHLLGLDHEKLAFYHNGIKRRLTDVHGHVIKDIVS